MGMRHCGMCGRILPKDANARKVYCRECLKKRHNASQRRSHQKHKAQRNNDNKERYHWLKEHGVCVKCASRPAVDGQTMCEACNKIHNAQCTRKEVRGREA